MKHSGLNAALPRRLELPLRRWLYKNSRTVSSVYLGFTAPLIVIRCVTSLLPDVNLCRAACPPFLARGFCACPALRGERYPHGSVSCAVTHVLGGGACFAGRLSFGLRRLNRTPFPYFPCFRTKESNGLIVSLLGFIPSLLASHWPMG